jgi:hypothetical protein
VIFSGEVKIRERWIRESRRRNRRFLTDRPVFTFTRPPESHPPFGIGTFTVTEFLRRVGQHLRQDWANGSTRPDHARWKSQPLELHSSKIRIFHDFRFARDGMISRKLELHCYVGRNVQGDAVGKAKPRK